MKNTSRTDWEALTRMSDAEIDYSDIAPLTEDFFRRARLWKPHQKVQVTVEVDADILEWFQTEDDDWEARLQAALRLYVETHRAYQQT